MPEVSSVAEDELEVITLEDELATNVVLELNNKLDPSSETLEERLGVSFALDDESPPQSSKTRRQKNIVPNKISFFIEALQFTLTLIYIKKAHIL